MSGGDTAVGESRMSITGQRLRINGLDFNVLVEGDGPDVLLIHGFPDSNAVWRNQIPALVEAGYRVIAPDLRASGRRRHRRTRSTMGSTGS